MKKDDFAKIPQKLVIIPSVNFDGTCPNGASDIANFATLFDIKMCAPVMTNAGTGEKNLFQCACPKGTSVPEPNNYDKALTGFNIGFCLEYTQT